MLGQCWNLETLDVTGSHGIEEEAGRLITKGTITVGNESVAPGLQNCHTLKISGSNIGEVSLPLMITAMPNLEHVELCKCE